LKNQIPLAIKYYEKALEVTGKRKSTPSPQELEAYIGLGHAYRFKNEMELAIPYYEEALRVAKELADKHHSAEISIELGDIYDSIEQDQTAMKHYANALNILEDVSGYDHMKMVALTRLKNFNQSRDHTISANSTIGKIIITVIF
jgi:tetratricopeptide (TPR) repeat protein